MFIPIIFHSLGKNVHWLSNLSNLKLNLILHNFCSLYPVQIMVMINTQTPTPGVTYFAATPALMRPRVDSGRWPGGLETLMNSGLLASVPAQHQHGCTEGVNQQV